MSRKPFKILGIEHIGIAVDDLNGISDIFGNLIGLELRSREKIDDQQVITDIYDTERGKLEFLKATDENSPIAQFIEKNGTGMHHIALIVDDIEVALNFLKERNINLVDSKPRIGAEGYKIAFIHPGSTGGVLIELCQKEE